MPYERTADAENYQDYDLSDKESESSQPYGQSIRDVQNEKQKSRIRWVSTSSKKPEVQGSVIIRYIYVALKHNSIVYFFLLIRIFFNHCARPSTKRYD